jgi:hypothetical protein
VLGRHAVWSLIVVLLIGLMPTLARAAPPDPAACLSAIDDQPGLVAVSTCEAAVSQTREPQLIAALAVALAEHDGESVETQERVYTLTLEAQDAAGGDVDVQLLLLRANIAVSDSIEVDYLLIQLAALADEDWRFHALATEWALDSDRHLDAATHLRRLRGLDVPPDELEWLESRYADEVPAWARSLALATHGLGMAWWCWLVGLGLTLSGGLGLSLATRARLRGWKPRAAEDLRPPGLLRPIHRLLLQASPLFYDSLLGLMVFGTLAFFVAAGLVAFAFNVIWWGLLLVAMMAMAAILRTALVRRMAAPGTRIDHHAQPQLMELSRRAAAAVGVEPAVELFITPHTDLDLTDQGRPFEILIGRRTKRALTIGLGLLETLDLEDLGILLTRLYATRRPTGGAGHSCADALAALETQFGHDTSPTRWINPGWYLLWAYSRSFGLMSLGPRYEQVRVADLLAAGIEGSERLANALVADLDCQVRHTAKLRAIETRIVQQGGPLRDVYRHEPDRPLPEQALSEGLTRAMEGPQGMLSLPSTSERVAWIEKLGLAARSDRTPERGPASAIVADRERLLERGTNAIRIGLERKLNKFIKLADEVAQTK